MTNTMSYSMFLNYIKEHIPEMLPSGFEATFTTADKVNYIADVVAITATDSDKTSYRACPSVDLCRMYEDYTNNRPLRDIMKFIISLTEIPEVPRPLEKVNLEELVTKEYIENNVIAMLISQQNNDELSKQNATKPWLDTYILLKVCVSSEGEQLCSYVLTKEICKKAGIVINDQLFSRAMSNNERLLPVCIQTISSIMESYGIPKRNSDELSMYVVSNNLGVNGAITILYSDVLKKISTAENNSDLLIFPSSLHECIIVPADITKSSNVTVDGLKNMVTEINMTNVSIEDKLTDQVYFYNVKTNSVSIAQ